MTTKKEPYSKLFEQFWSVYPRRTAKAVAGRAWAKHVDESDAFMAKAIINDIEKRTRLRWWPTDTEKIPHAATWINQGRYLDEGWEDEVKNRGKQTISTYSKMPTLPDADDGPQMSPWQMMLNRLARNYLMHAGGLSEGKLKIFQNVIREVVTKLIPVAEEEIANATDKKKARQDAGMLMAETMLNRFDIDLGLNLRQRVLTISRRSS